MTDGAVGRPCHSEPVSVGSEGHRAVPAPGGERLLRRVTAGRADEPVTHIQRIAARGGETGPWPAWVPALLRSRLGMQGVELPWAHQIEAAELAHSGRSVVLATGTASGKSLGYQVPVLSDLLADERATALYLAPTKALGNDQIRSVRDLRLVSIRAAAYDGDTPISERDWVRAHARWVFTNPDMLHLGLLPAHQRWSSFFRRLRYVVVDECHSYRGIFGSHVAHVLRRLRRVCRRYAAEPVFVLASATSGQPAESARRLTGLPVTAVTRDAAPRGELTFALWEPPLTELVGEHGAPLRRSTIGETSRLLADLVVQGARTLAFVRSRRAAELVAVQARASLAEAGAPDLARRVAAYRAGYLPTERRALEAELSSGRLLGVAATNALELGIDVSGLDAVILAGYPGTLASLWQQAGRAGRRGGAALAVLIAKDDPLDTYLVHHPQAIFGRSVEATVTDPGNPHVLGPQLCAASADLPLTAADLPLFGGSDDGGGDGDDGGVRERLAALVDEGLLRVRPAGWYWTSRQRPRVDIRGTGGEQVAIVESSTGQLLGTVEPGSAHSAVHKGAVYLHQGSSYVVDHLDLERATAAVHADQPPWTTHARDITDLTIASVLHAAAYGPVRLCFGVVDVINQVVAYQRRRLGTGEVLGEEALDLPPRELRTRSVWYTIDETALGAAGLDDADLPGALHAAEHAAIGILPLFASCDRWDIGGVSTALHQDTGRPTVFVYDGHPGGAGFAEHGHRVAGQWLGATRDAIDACECATGCPSCVQSPKCGNGNDPLDKAGAVRILDVVLSGLVAAG